MGENPFEDAARAIAAATGNSADEARVISRILEFKQLGLVRRYGAFVRHRKMGYAFNGMTVWNAPEERLPEIGRAFAAFSAVSHCYSRTPAQTWPYNLYAMVHAKTREELDGYVEDMKAASGLTPRVLLSTKEYKKTLPAIFGGPLKPQ